MVNSTGATVYYAPFTYGQLRGMVKFLWLKVLSYLQYKVLSYLQYKVYFW